MADTEAEGIVKPFGDMEPRERWLFALETLGWFWLSAVIILFSWVIVTALLLIVLVL